MKGQPGTGRRIAGQGSNWIRRTTRIAIYARDGWACVYCGARAEDDATLTLDHVLACELGGTNAPGNLVTCCLSCNSAKQHRSNRDWFAMLRDRGVDTRGLAERVRRHCARKLDREGARATLAARG